MTARITKLLYPRHGVRQGDFTSANGDAYDSAFGEGRQHGLGKCKSGDGPWRKCLWRHGEITGWPK